jgi:hypothetical protein
LSVIFLSALLSLSHRHCPLEIVLNVMCFSFASTCPSLSVD